MISVESFTRARELVNRIDNLDAQIKSSLTKNENLYSSIGGIVNIDNISKIINDFSANVNIQGNNISANLQNLKEFLNTQITEYENINQNAGARFQQTQTELTEVSNAASSALDGI